MTPIPKAFDVDFANADFANFLVYFETRGVERKTLVR